jgi:Bifunctional DNA primase/polymerase, N-terminal
LNLSHDCDNARRCCRPHSSRLVPYRKKGPELKDWPSLRISEADAPRYFNGAKQNIGVVLGPCSGNLCDVDLDCDEAIAAAVLLPLTVSFGRASTPAAHRLYVCRNPTGDKAVIPFKDPLLQTTDAKAAMLLELRLGTGKKAAQTIFPPSVHEGGEAITWSTGDDTRSPTELDGAELAALCASVAAAALLIRHWPTKGNRHELSLALGGSLARIGWDAAAIEQFVAVVVHAARDPRPDDRCAAPATLRRRRRGAGIWLSKLKERRPDFAQALRVARPRQRQERPCRPTDHGLDCICRGGRTRAAWRRTTAVPARCRAGAAVAARCSHFLR